MTAPKETTGGDGGGSNRTKGRVLANPNWVTALFSSTHFAWFWMIVRIYLGVSWLNSGWHKLSEDGWTGTGFAVKGFWERAVVVPETGRAAISYDWYREFLEFMLNNELYGVFGTMVAYGEVLVGIGLLLGALTGVAAFFGALMNWNFMLAGTASTNPLLGIIAIGVIVAWKTAGWWGVDRLILPYIGAPWERGKLLGGDRLVVEGEEPHSVRRYAEEWVRMAIAAGLAIYGLVYLEGGVLLIVMGIAILTAATTGLGFLFAPEKKTA